MRFYRVIFSGDDHDDRFFESHEHAHTVLTRAGFTVPNRHWPDTWEKRPDRYLPDYAIRASGEYVETERVLLVDL